MALFKFYYTMKLMFFRVPSTLCTKKKYFYILFYLGNRVYRRVSLANALFELQKLRNYRGRGLKENIYSLTLEFSWEISNKLHSS